MSRGRWVLALLLILLGGAFLAANLGVVDWDFLLSAWLLWPLLLVVLGIWLLLGPRRRGLAAVLILLVLAAGAGLALVGSQQGRFAEVKEREGTFAGPPASSVRRALLIADLGAAEVNITAGSGGAVIEADYRARGEVVVADTGQQDNYEVEFSQRGRSFLLPFLRGGGRHFFDLRLAPEIPWDLDLDVGAADANFDLSGITLSSLELDAGASSLDLRVGPDIVEGATINVDGGAASFDVALPEELTITLHMEGGLSSTDVGEGFQERGENTFVHEGGGPEMVVNLRAGVSSINVELY